MTIKDRITSDLKDAMRARDQSKLNALRLITAAVKQIEVDERIDIDEARMLDILVKLAKQRNESISQFKAASRDDLVFQEKFELDIIQQYMPEPLAEEEIIQLIDQVFADLNASKMSDMGAIMSQLRPLMQGRADMSRVSALIKSKLS